MITDQGRLSGHEKFKQLAALASSGALAPGELAELLGHLQDCEECRDAYREYIILTAQGMPMLADTYSRPPEPGRWDDSATREKLFARVRAAEAKAQSFSLQGVLMNPMVQAALAACLVVAIGVAGYRVGNRREKSEKQVETSSEKQSVKLAAENAIADDLLSAQTRLSQLKEQSSHKEQEFIKLRSALRELEDQSKEITAANVRMEEQLRSVSQERDALYGQLRSAEQDYARIQAELVSLRAERDKAVLRTASLEARLDDLIAINREQERRLKDDEQYLASDRDIRELMGARKLYIADVFDVDSRSRTRKPFGRVFYTQSKSLIFYAFDLDQQPAVKNASAFQVWGRKESSQGTPMSLGLLYMDNEANRRWALRCDDLRQLAEIDAVFVTVEPNGGSHRPTGKPLLYASLREEVNHP
jgi:Anti-sigma-K factor rskA